MSKDYSYCKIPKYFFWPSRNISTHVQFFWCTRWEAQAYETHNVFISRQSVFTICVVLKAWIWVYSWYGRIWIHVSQTYLEKSCSQCVHWTVPRDSFILDSECCPLEWDSRLFWMQPNFAYPGKNLDQLLRIYLVYNSGFFHYSHLLIN